MENEEFELMYNFIYKNYKKNEIKQAIDGVCNYIANKQIKNYNKKMLAELLTKIAELTPYNAIVWSVRENKKNNKKIKNIMETKELKTNEKELIKELVEALLWCSGSNDFQEDGIAREGWLKVKELIDEALEYLKQNIMEKENVKIIIKGEEIGSGIIVDGFLIFDYEDKMIICELEESGNYGYIKSRRVIDKGIVDIDNITTIKKLFI